MTVLTLITFDAMQASLPPSRSAALGTLGGPRRLIAKAETAEGGLFPGTNVCADGCGFDAGTSETGLIPGTHVRLDDDGFEAGTSETGLIPGTHVRLHDDNFEVGTRTIGGLFDSNLRVDDQHVSYRFGLLPPIVFPRIF